LCRAHVPGNVGATEKARGGRVCLGWS
jgi:hypothetical protein